MIKRTLPYIVALIIVGIGCWLSVILILGIQNFSWQLILIAGGCLLAIGLIWAARKLNHKVWLVAGLLLLAALVLPVSMLIKVIPNRQSDPFGTLMAITLLLIVPMAIIVSAMLLSSGLTLYRAEQKEGDVKDADAQATSEHTGKNALIYFVLSALLLAKTMHTLYFLTVWDNTTDPLGYFWLVFPILVLFFSGVLLIAILPGREKLAGLLYVLLIPALYIVVSAGAQRVDFRQLTEERAERVNQAIESYYAREGHYPQDLGQLTPRTILSLSEPVIIYGQEWCFDGGDDYYRLGYVYREHWSDPRLSGRIYKTKGDVPDLHGLCEEEVVALQKSYPGYPYEYWMDGE